MRSRQSTFPRLIALAAMHALTSGCRPAPSTPPPSRCTVQEFLNRGGDEADAADLESIDRVTCPAHEDGTASIGLIDGANALPNYDFEFLVYERRECDDVWNDQIIEDMAEKVLANRLSSEVEAALGRLRASGVVVPPRPTRFQLAMAIVFAAGSERWHWVPRVCGYGESDEDKLTDEKCRTHPSDMSAICACANLANPINATVHGVTNPLTLDVFLFRSACTRDGDRMYGVNLSHAMLGLRFWMIAGHELGHQIDIVAGGNPLSPGSDIMLAEDRATAYGTHFAECSMRAWATMVSEDRCDGCNDSTRYAHDCVIDDYARNIAWISRCRTSIVTRYASNGGWSGPAGERILQGVTCAEGDSTELPFPKETARR